MNQGVLYLYVRLSLTIHNDIKDLMAIFLIASIKNKYCSYK